MMQTSMSGILQGNLWRWNEEKCLDAFSSGEISELSLPIKVICLGGLTDGFNACPWIFSLSSACREHGWNLIQPLISSSYLGYGTGSLDRDTEELVTLIRYLHVQRNCTNVVLVGHSTGCQNIIHLLKHASHDIKSRILAIVLQAPVSDQEAGEMEECNIKNLKYARHQVESYGENSCEQILMPLSMHSPPITVSRFLSLFGRYGADDMFSSYLTDAELLEKLNVLGVSSVEKESEKIDTDRSIRALVAFSLEDEYVPEFVSKERLVSRICGAMGASAQPLLLENANHNLSLPENGIAIEKFVKSIVELILCALS